MKNNLVLSSDTRHSRKVAYSFGSKSRLKLQYEKWTIELPSGLKNTRADDSSHVFDITIEGNELVIPDALHACISSIRIR
ncbi:hypothetical protein [Paenibacillus sp. XY044]|uniref:hypothetical protein n=1 Tax=Paenibacillus sp. XY044 TaxID=2026089 RepID=UPI001C52FB2F|nr:hypothetical protein [Paenibacillus sp. XY044]